MDFHQNNFRDVESNHCSKNIMCNMMHQCVLDSNLHHQNSMGKSDFELSVSYGKLDIGEPVLDDCIGHHKTHHHSSNHNSILKTKGLLVEHNKGVQINIDHI